LALLAALLTATAALLAALLTTPLTSGLLLLLTRLLLATLLAALLLPALFHITHLVTRHGELSFADGLRGTTISLNPCRFPIRQLRWAAMPENTGTRIKGGR
jgi:hypothetical protein